MKRPALTFSEAFCDLAFSFGFVLGSAAVLLEQKAAASRVAWRVIPTFVALQLVLWAFRRLRVWWSR